MKRTIYLLFLLSVILTGCRTPKTLITDSEFKEQKNIENNISVQESSKIDETIEQAVQKFFDEKVNINVNTTIYDTDKPADPETGRHPVKEETNINFNKETKETIAEIVNTETIETTVIQLEDKSIDKSKVNSSEKTETRTGLATWQKVLIVVGLIAVIGLILFVVLRIKRLI